MEKGYVGTSTQQPEDGSTPVSCWPWQHHSILRSPTPLFPWGDCCVVLGLTGGSETGVVAWPFQLVVLGMVLSPLQHGSLAPNIDMGTWDLFSLRSE